MTDPQSLPARDLVETLVVELAKEHPDAATCGPLWQELLNRTVAAERGGLAVQRVRMQALAVTCATVIGELYHAVSTETLSAEHGRVLGRVLFDFFLYAQGTPATAGKYGTFAGFQARLHPGEPWFGFKGRDRFTPDVVERYADLLQAFSPADLTDLATDGRAAARRIYEWQKANPELVKTPD